MKHIYTLLIFILFLFTFSSNAQNSEIKKVFIANGKIITAEEVATLKKEGKIKSMKVSQTDKEKEELAKIHGDFIKDSFVAILTLHSDKPSNEENLDTKGTNTKSIVIKRNADGKIDKSDLENQLTNPVLIKEGEQAPDFTANYTNGEKINLSDLKGKVVLLNFWATWCAPCLMEFHEIPSKILERFEGKEFVFIPVAVKESKEKVAGKMSKLKQKGIDFPVVYDPNNEIGSQYFTSGIPKNFIIDQNGEIVYISTGYNETSVDKIADKIEETLIKVN
ncbi:TlpA disulfide reductase family protein [Mangrovivirga sp. M17]|uniref:TlpA disulfide reductase family protein n=1 Tax=Mangrovivirga halotolerans TaxID=2993936 RepID=A0ABT3RUA8_9BACT|nr:TlpA disulfide reductase family protein [Mangrovivirga halotolerans]MCX2745364.1 TlpA disulfide reductase family protein [Mangrovivirga halotolerans]